MAQARLSSIASHLTPGPAYLQKNDNDVVIVAAKRTPLTKAFKGPLSQLQIEDLLSAALKGTMEAGGVDPSLIEDVCMGTVLPPKGGATVCRMAQLHAGIPIRCTTSTVNRQCSSGLQAITAIANMITSGQIDIGIGGGVESMSHHYVAPTLPPDQKVSAEVTKDKEANDCLMSNGDTSENVSKDYRQTRRALDEYAARSFQRAEKAQKDGNFDEEIIPVFIDKDGKTIEVKRDDGIRAGTTAETLGRLKPVFYADGLSTAGNSSQLTDGAAAVVLARRSVAKQLGLPIIGKYVMQVQTGVPARIMGVGPAYAIPKLLEKVGAAKDAIDFYEINEAFASQVLFSIDHLGLDHAKVNPNGGAIALGHPLGATGARQVATGLSHAKRTGSKTFVVSMCCGTGLGVAALFVNEQ